MYIPLFRRQRSDPECQRVPIKERLPPSLKDSIQGARQSTNYGAHQSSRYDRSNHVGELSSSRKRLSLSLMALIGPGTLAVEAGRGAEARAKAGRRPEFQFWSFTGSPSVVLHRRPSP
jgi:hypothetical protein